MVCDCGKKMSCRFSAPVMLGEQEVRFRMYNCSNCMESLETLEVPRELVESEEMKAALKQGRESRFLFYKRLKRRG
jgi:hypothetical protein